MAVALLFATQNYITLINAGRQIGWTDTALHEILVWSCWVVTSPLIFAVARRFPILKGRYRNIPIHLVTAALITLLNIFLFSALVQLLGLEERPDLFFDLVMARYRNSFAVMLAVYCVTVTVYYTLEYYRAYRRRELAASQLETQLVQARLDLLRMQLHPHFLFNTLHGISALMAKDVPTARKMITQLSDLLRITLENDSAQEIPLSEELDFLHRYIELQKMRFQERLLVELEIEPGTESILVPRLMLQPLVENAIQHGVSRHAKIGVIRIAAYLKEKGMRLTVEDNGSGIGEGPLREGVGLSNTRERIERLYGNEGSFAIENGADGGSIVTIDLPARTTSSRSMAT